MKITLENVFYKYNKNEDYILQNINLELTSSPTYIVGENGSGKTTLINLLNGIYKPTLGRIFLNDIEISRIKTLKKDVSIVYQFSDNQLFNLTVKEDLLYVFRKQKTKKVQVLEEIKEYFELFNLPITLLEANPFKLSGGEKKKIAIISSLILHPKVIVLDEPTIGLDNESKNNINEIIKKLSKDILIIVISHDLEQVYKYASDIVVLKDQKIEEVTSNYLYFKGKYQDNKLNALPEKLRICKYLNLEYEKCDEFKNMEELKDYVYKRIAEDENELY